MNWGSRTWREQKKKKLTLILPQSHKKERTIARLKKYLKKQWLEVFQIKWKTEPYQSNTTVENPKKYTPQTNHTYTSEKRKKNHQSIRNTGEQKFKRQSISHQKPKKPEGSGIVFSSTKEKHCQSEFYNQWKYSSGMKTEQLTWKRSYMVISCQQTYSKEGLEEVIHTGRNINKRKLRITGMKKGQQKGKHSKLFYSLVLRFIFDRSKKYSILSIQRHYKDDFTVKGTGQSNVGSKISTFYLKDKMLILLDCDSYVCIR